MSNQSNENSNELIEWVKERMAEKNLSYKDMQIPGGIHYQTLVATMNGRLPPGPKFYTTISEVFQVPLTTVMAIAGEKTLILPEGDYADPDEAITDFVDWLKKKMEREGIDGPQAFSDKSEGLAHRNAFSMLLNRKINAGVQTCMAISFALNIPLHYVRKKAGHDSPDAPPPKDFSAIIAKLDRLHDDDVAMVEALVDRLLSR